MGKRIDQLQPGAMVRLRFDYGEEAEDAVFVGFHFEDEGLRARFVQASDTGSLYSWEAYRFEGRWCYGTSAGRLSLDEVVDEFSLRASS